MTDENIEDIAVEEVPEEFLTKETFSFFDVLSERAYPRDTVTLYMNEGAAYELNQLIEDLDSADESEAEELGKRAQELEQRIKASAFTFYLTGVSDDRVSDVTTITNEKFKSRKLNRRTASGAIETYMPESAQMDYLRYFSALTLSLHIEQVVDSQGRSMLAPIDPDQISFLMDKAPTHEKAKLQTAIEKLRVKSSSFEASVDEGFLAKP